MTALQPTRTELTTARLHTGGRPTDFQQCFWWWRWLKSNCSDNRWSSVKFESVISIELSSRKAINWDRYFPNEEARVEIVGIMVERDNARSDDQLRKSSFWRQNAFNWNWLDLSALMKACPNRGTSKLIFALIFERTLFEGIEKSINFPQITLIRN
jgi:hypothetical protein